MEKVLRERKPDIGAACIFVIGGMKALALDSIDCRNIEKLFEMGLITVDMMGAVIDVCLNNMDEWKHLTEKACYHCVKYCKETKFKGEED